MFLKTSRGVNVSNKRVGWNVSNKLVKFVYFKKTIVQVISVKIDSTSLQVQ